MNKQMTEALLQGDNTPVVLVGANGDVEITSIELVQLINTFRAEEGNETEKQHKEMLRDIRNEIEVLEKAGIAQRNFALGSYRDLNNQERPCYKLNKAGTLQMLNKESAVVRYKTVCYIEKLEKQLKSNNIYSGLSKELQAIFAIDAKQQEHDARLSKLENNMTLDHGQQLIIQQLVNKRGVDVLGSKTSAAYKLLSKKTFQEIYKMLKNSFQVPSYRDIPVKRFEEAKTLIANWMPSQELQLMIIGANAQLTLETQED